MVYITLANFYYSHTGFMEGDKRMHTGAVIEAGTKFESEENDYIRSLLASGFIKPYEEEVLKKPFNSGTTSVGGTSEPYNEEKASKKK